MPEEIGDRPFGSESGRDGFADLHLTLANRTHRPGAERGS
jgi:hypothetical protein